MFIRSVWNMKLYTSEKIAIGLAVGFFVVFLVVVVI